VRCLIAVALLCACGGGSGRKAPIYDEPPAQPISVEWRVEQGAGNTVDVSLVVNGRSIAIGALDAATELEAGTPSTCALRAASPRRTEIVCGDANAYVADLVDGALVISFVAEQRSEVKRVPVAGDVLAVKMLVLPGSKL
jgi:hypothetical protein